MRRRRRNVFNNKMSRTLTVLYLGILAVLFALCVIIAKINRDKGDDYTITVLNQQNNTSRKIPYKRGDIIDRNGYTLATSVKVYNLILDAKMMLEKKEYLEATVSALVKSFDLNETELRETINANKDSRYIVALKGIEYEKVKPFQELQKDTKNNPDIMGVWFETEYVRKYPYNELGSKVIGFTNSGNSADWGIEGYYCDELNGVDGREYGYVNSDNNMEKVIRNATNGYNITSTLDMEIQKIVEKKIKDYKKETKAKRIAVMIADPNTGEILSMADDMSYDLNNPRDLSDFFSKKELKKMSDEDQLNELNKLWRCYCINDSFEPGSTAKPFTVAAALEEGLVSTNDTFYCDGSENVGGWNIHCSGTHGTLTLEGTIVNSCNDALMQIGAKLGASTFSNYQTRFGFGVRTGIDLSGETPGLVYDEKDINSSTLATNAFGQNFTVNMMQIEAGFCSLVNGGNYYQPRVVREIVDEKGNVIKNFSKTLIKQTITQDTCDFERKALRETVLSGTGFRAEVPGYTVGGKTGTAEKSPRGSGEYVLSFIGAVPIEDPQVVCYVVVDTPEKDPDNSAYATIFYNKIMSEVLPYLNVPKTETKEEADRAKANKKSSDENYEGNIIEGENSGIVDNEGNYGGATGTDNTDEQDNAQNDAADNPDANGEADAAGEPADNQGEVANVE